MLAHPEVAYRPCEMCLKYLYDHETGKLKKDHHDKPIERPKGSKAPCQYVLGRPLEIREKACAKISPDSAAGLTEQNQAAYDHYRECRAVGQFPDDPIVRQNARVIRDLEDMHESVKLQRAIIAGGMR